MSAVSLTKGNSTAVEAKNLTFTVKWALSNTAKGRFGTKPKLDLDASAAALTAAKNVIGFCFYGFPEASRGAMIHQGDAKAKGGSKWASESIEVNLARLAADVDKVVFVLNSYKSDKFSNLGEAYVEVTDRDTVIAEATLELISGSNAYALAAFERDGNGGWKLTNINKGQSIGNDEDAVKQFASKAM